MDKIHYTNYQKQKKEIWILILGCLNNILNVCGSFDREIRRTFDDLINQNISVNNDKQKISDYDV
jgi:hypothetical protein